MSNFEDFFSEYEDKHNCSPEKYECFEAGAQSKQAEVDEYKEVASSMEDAYIREKAKVDELRKRIDEAMRLLNTRNHNPDVTQLIFKIQNEILKGTTNEQ